ncbi:hypothetical protein GW17_00038905 [Ensete ventricosum]|nr:hypothetical protein GW17_00038905 [Ensete ventricosum]
MAGAYWCRQRLQGWRQPIRMAPVRMAPVRMAPARKGGACRHNTLRSYRSRGSDACCKGGHPWARWPLDEGRRGGLGHPFEKRMIMPLEI